MDNYLVIGLGDFGQNLALALAKSGADVMIIDNNENKINKIKDKVSSAVCLDITDENALRTVLPESIDVAIVAIGVNIQSSIWAVSSLVDANINTIIAKANSHRHGNILYRLGAHQVIFPEITSAEKLCNKLILHNTQNIFSLSTSYSCMLVPTPPGLIGQKMKSIISDFQKYSIYMIGINRIKPYLDNHGEEIREEELLINPNPEVIVFESDLMILIGREEALKQLLTQKELFKK